MRTLHTRSGDSAPSGMAPQNVASPEAIWLEEQIAKGRDGPHVVLGCRITPQLAQLLLDRNPENRHISDYTVERYRQDLINGRWLLNGETIKVSVDGKLNDGQHRLWAVLLANQPMVSDIRFGLPRASRMTVDQGVRRTPGNVFQMRGIKEGTNVAAALSIVLMYHRPGGIPSHDTQGVRPTTVEIERAFDSHPGILDAVQAAQRVYAVLRAPTKSQIAALIFLTDQIDPAASQNFWDALENGLDLSANDPRYVLRQRLLRQGPLGGQQSGNVQMARRWYNLALVIKAWNAWREHRPLRLLRMSEAEPFPRLV